LILQNHRALKNLEGFSVGIYFFGNSLNENAMDKISDYQLLLTTCPDKEIANQLAHNLVENHLAACVNILPNIQSVYEWKEKIVSDTEMLLFIKTRHEHYAAIEQMLLQQHPYDVPELIGLPITTGLPDYLKWLDDVVNNFQS
jgi:periplasmic divalent cation tolerance protein